MKRRLATVALCLVALPAAFADDAKELEALLESFLANVSERGAHERFWAEDLVYTSSAGARFGKAEILANMEGGESPEPGPRYAAEEVDVRLYGETAVVAFRLVAMSAGGDTEYYYNTGTFAHRNGRWEVVAWQATRIPAEGGDEN